MVEFDASFLTASVAIASALVAGVFCGELAYAAWKRQRYATKAIAENRHKRIEMLLHTGVPSLLPIARWFLKYQVISDSLTGFVVLVERKGYSALKDSLFTLVVTVACFVGIIVGLIAQSVACGIAVSLGLVVAVLGWAHAAYEKYLVSMREDVPEALRSMGACFRSGLSLLQTLQQTSSEIGGPLGEQFGVAAKRLEMGATTTEALAALNGGSKVPELAFVAVALDVQHQSGGSIAPVLEAARESVEGELELMRSLRVQTAQAKLSARIVTLMPFVLIALFSLMSTDFLQPFFSSAAGVGLLLLALAMQLLGVLLVRRMLDVEMR